MAVWKNKGLKYATIVLAVLSLLSVVATFGVGKFSYSVLQDGFL